MRGAVSYRARQVFDGRRFVEGALVVEDGRILGIGPPMGTTVDLGDGTLAPGFVDLQVNGSAGHAVNGDITVEGLAAICEAQTGLGTTACLPTLITDTPEATRRVIETGIAAAGAGVPGFLGLHLEGPHLDPRRKGAHAAELIRPMAEQDLELIMRAASALPHLIVTVAPESVTLDQIRAMAQAGVIVSLGHSDCSAASAMAAIAAGASCVTHLFNAMSQLSGREPGLVGAALGAGIAAGLIADGFHVDPLSIRIALAANPEAMFLVSDCMQVQGTEQDSFFLGGRRILRNGGRLTLQDGTLAGADLELWRAVKVMVDRVGVSPATALAMATSRPASVIGDQAVGKLRPNAPAHLVYLDADWKPAGIWRDGKSISPRPGRWCAPS